jgi:cytochrome c
LVATHDVDERIATMKILNIIRTAFAAPHSQTKKFSLVRRATLMLVAAGAAGTVAPSVWARAALGNRNEAVRKSTAAVSPGRESENQKIGSASPLQDLKKLGPQWQVVTVCHAQGAYSVTTADGRKVDFREADLRFKIDSSTAGPANGKPVILPTGMMGDRASVILASPAEIGTLINRHG